MSKTSKNFSENAVDLTLLDIAKDNLQYDISAATSVNHDHHSPEATELMRVLSKTEKGLHAFFKPILDTRDAQQLLNFVLEGNEEKVFKAAKSNPGLFFIQATGNDKALDLASHQRTVEEYSPYQAIFATGNIEMLLRVKPYLDLYLNEAKKKELAILQEKEKFPNGFDYPPCSDQFKRIIDDLAAAISNDQQLLQSQDPSPSTLALLATFREYMKPTTVKMGYYFNMNEFIKAHRVNDEHWIQWNMHQLSFFCVNVIGFQERMMSSYYLKLICAGFDNKNQSSRGDFEVLDAATNKKSMLLPLKIEKPTYRLGVDFMIDFYKGLRVEWKGSSWCTIGRTIEIEKHIKQVAATFQNCAYQNESTTSSLSNSNQIKP